MRKAPKSMSPGEKKSGPVTTTFTPTFGRGMKGRKGRRGGRRK